MNEFNFILLTIVLVLIIVFIANKILSKKVVEKKALKQEKFSENLNDLDNIIEGVAKKEIIPDNETLTEDVDEEEEEPEVKEEEKTEKKLSNQKKTLNVNLKDSIIAKEILDRRDKLK
jgi:hypothetical protein